MLSQKPEQCEQSILHVHISYLQINYVNSQCLLPFIYNLTEVCLNNMLYTLDLQLATNLLERTWLSIPIHIAKEYFT